MNPGQELGCRAHQGDFRGGLVEESVWLTFWVIGIQGRPGGEKQGRREMEVLASAKLGARPWNPWPQQRVP